MKRKTDLLQGTLDMLVLKALEGETRHGYAIAKVIETATGDVLRVEEGSLYPALHRLERKGLIASTWGRSENKRRARYYQLTDAGQLHLTSETENWNVFAQAVTQMMGPSAP